MTKLKKAKVDEDDGWRGLETASFQHFSIDFNCFQSEMPSKTYGTAVR